MFRMMFTPQNWKSRTAKLIIIVAKIIFWMWASIRKSAIFFIFHHMSPFAKTWAMIVAMEAPTPPHWGMSK